MADDKAEDATDLGPPATCSELITAPTMGDLLLDAGDPRLLRIRLVSEPSLDCVRLCGAN